MTKDSGALGHRCRSGVSVLDPVKAAGRLHDGRQGDNVDGAVAGVGLVTLYLSAAVVTVMEVRGSGGRIGQSSHPRRD